ncbi:hypothetical protein F0562_007906 [Nyssa sinensis]|uniref:PGG domain-containing protein n=1 Tax=Nyssa sinensis TaxID=561372 RepID=A0A5J5A715_9ASTE|nr:hypothetical protein F0562_007906 [Nyssa sinensis]
MEQKLMEAARAGDISELYRLIRQDPYVLERFDGIPFVDTPLHAAASAGNTPFAIEIARLKPSFGRKLNQDGLSPIHLALECGHDQTVRKLISLDRELICVQGKEGITPLHYVTERQNLDLLATFLFNCPTSIEKLTNRGETAVHIAVKNQNFGAFEILLAWLHAWADMKEILELKDDEGNTVLHIAAKTNQHQVAELLVDKVNINARNSDGLTARDLLLQLSSQQNISEFKKILSNKRAKGASSLPEDETLAEILRPKLPFYERWARFVFRMQRELTSSMRENLLVVAVLIVTATYQAALQPPGGFRQE